MKKLFISVPMRNRTEYAIKASMTRRERKVWRSDANCAARKHYFTSYRQLECLLLRTSAKKNRESSDIQDGSCF